MKQLVIAIVLILSTHRAGAEPEWAKGVPAETQAQANKLFAEANQLFAQQAHAPALEKYRAAIALWDHPMIRYNMAVTLIRLDRILEAADNLEKALRFGETPFSTPELYQQALDYQALVKRQVGDVAASCDQADAHVLLDGKPWFDCPGSKTLRVLAGEHALVAEKKGYMTRSQRLVVAGGATSTEKMSLLPIESVVKLEYRYPRWIPWTIAGTGVAVALGGLGFWFAGRNQMDKFESDFAMACPTGCPASLSTQPLIAEERDSAELKGKIAISMMISGGAITVGGVVMAIVNRPKRILPNMEVAPINGGMIGTFSGHF